MTVEDDSASRPWSAARRRSGKRKRSADAVLQQLQGSPVVPPSSDIEEYYSRAYSQIKDHAHMEAYRDGILRHQPLISGKVVLNIGCGTGILAIFCALAGATRVYAIDGSPLAVRVKDVDCYTVTIQELASVTTRSWVTSTLRAPLHGFLHFGSLPPLEDLQFILPSNTHNFP